VRQDIFPALGLQRLGDSQLQAMKELEMMHEDKGKRNQETQLPKTHTVDVVAALVAAS